LKEYNILEQNAPFKLAREAHGGLRKDKATKDQYDSQFEELFNNRKGGMS
jgi:hypothetical protein